MALFESVIPPHMVHRLGWTLLHFVWQGTIVAIVLAILLRALRKSAANARYIICCSALVLIVGLPVVTIQLVSSPAGQPVVELEPGPKVAPVATPAEPPKELPVFEPVEVTETRRIESPAAASSTPLRDRLAGILEPALPYIVVSWLLGVLGLSIWHLGGWTQLQRLRRTMVQPVDKVLQSRVREIAEQLGIRRSVQAVKSALVQVPTVIGWLRPVILLPASALTGLSMEQLEAILAHELAHIRRYDYLVNMLQTVVEILGFYHPAVWWVSHRIRLERENCCDDLAARMAGRERYARALTVMEEIRGRQPRLAVAASGGNLFKRIQRLIVPASAQHKDLSWVPAALAILLIIMLAVPTTLGLAGSKPKPQEKKDVEGILEKVRQAQRPGEVMEVEWEFEAGKIPEDVHIAWHRSPVPYKHMEEYKAVFDGVRSRLEYHTEGYKTEEPKGPYISVLDTTVFDGKKQRVLMSREYDGKRQEQFGREREGYNKNIRTITRYVNSWPINFNDKKELEKYEFAVVDGDKPGVHILELRTDGRLSSRLAIDGNRGFSIVKSERFDAEGRKEYERRVTLKRHSNGIWYPSEVKTIAYWVDFRKATRPVESTTRIAKVRFDPKVSADTFELVFPEGTKVWDKTRGIYLVIGKSGLPEKIDVESVLTRVRQAQKPAENMRIELESEHGGGGGWAVPLDPEKQTRLAKYEGTAVLSGVRTRFEQTQETYYTKDVDEPRLILGETYVFDGKTCRSLQKFLKGFENTRSLGYFGLGDTGLVLMRQHVFGGDEPPIHDQERLEEWEFAVSESDVPGVLILDSRKLGRQRKRLTVDGNRGYNIVKKEWLWKDGSTLLEDNFQVKQHSNGVWFVSGRERIRYSREDKSFRDVEATMKVTGVEFDIKEPEEETFKLEFPPGTKVGFPGGEIIVVGEDAEAELREVMESAERLKGLGKAVFIYASDDEKGRFANTLQQLLEGDYVSKEALEWLVENVEYLGKGKTAADAHDSPIALDKTILQKGKGTNILYVDGHVAFRSVEELQKLLGIQPAALLRLIELKERQESARKLMGLGKAVIIYANDDEEGRFPDTLQQLLEGDYVSKEALEWLVENVEYLGKGKKAMDAPNAAIAYDKTLLQKGEGTNVLFLDGHVAFESVKKLKELGIRFAVE